MKKIIAITNTAKLIFFCTLAGAAAGLVLWVFLRVIYLGTELIWFIVPEAFNKQTAMPIWYPPAACTLGGLIIGLFRRKFGDYPQSMMQVLGTVKKTGTYPYDKIAVVMIAAILPLIFGSSVGPEAGMVGTVVALGCWVNDNLKHAGRNASLYSRIGMAVSLSILFYSPLFGFFSAAEEDDENILSGSDRSGKASRILIYAIAITAALGVIMLLNTLFGRASGGLPRFEDISLTAGDLAMGIPYMLAGMALGWCFEKTELLFAAVSRHIPAVVKETAAGLLLGACITLVPSLAFSGEEQIGILIESFEEYLPVIILALGLAKVLLTNICIQMGLKGGHFFPMIFAAVCLGFGISLLVFPGSVDHAAFGAAVVTAGTMGVLLRKPLASTCLLLLCFPMKAVPCIFVAAVISGTVTKALSGSDKDKEERTK
ncbi:MAG: chloride channel protein [Lentihominibacter sp.]